MVLAHEMVHVAWRDPLRHVMTRVALAIYWFHPLAWIAARRAAAAREDACDEAVVALGTRPSAYARVLVDLAGEMRRSVTACRALPMVQPSRLEERVMTILNDVGRPAGRQLALLPVLGVVLATVVVAAARPASLTFRPAVAPQPVSSTATQATPHVAPRVVVAESPVSAGAPDSACSWVTGSDMSFSGSMSIDGTNIREQIGRRGNDRIVQKTFGDLRVCMVAEGASENDRPSQLAGHARRVVLETQRGSAVQRLEIGQDGRTTWRVNWQERAFDAAAKEWRDRMLTLLDTTWELATLRGQVSTLHGQISTIYGQRSTLQGQISTLRGEVSTMHGEISTVRGHESSLHGQISSIQGHLSSLQGAISSERGVISSLDARRYNATDAERQQITTGIADHQAAIARIEREVRDYDADGRAAAVERELTAYGADAKVAAIETRIKALDVDGKVAAIEEQIKSLDADRRTADLSTREHGDLTRLEAAVAAIR